MDKIEYKRLWVVEYPEVAMEAGGLKPFLIGNTKHYNVLNTYFNHRWYIKEVKKSDHTFYFVVKKDAKDTDSGQCSLKLTKEEYDSLLTSLPNEGSIDYFRLECLSKHNYYKYGITKIRFDSITDGPIVLEVEFDDKGKMDNFTALQFDYLKEIKMNIPYKYYLLKKYNGLH